MSRPAADAFPFVPAWSIPTHFPRALRFISPQFIVRLHVHNLLLMYRITP